MNKNWYILAHPSLTYNKIFPALNTIGVGVIGKETGTTYIKRRVDNRSLLDRLYRLRYVIPKEHVNARAPKPGFILQESKTVGIGSASFLTADLSNPTQLRNPKIIKNATYSSQVMTFTTEERHRLQPGDLVTIRNVESVNNPLNTFKIGFNSVFPVDTVVTAKQFTVSGISTDPSLSLTRTTREQHNNRLRIFLLYRDLRQQIPSLFIELLSLDHTFLAHLDRMVYIISP